jgi:hypothetical protein
VINRRLRTPRSAGTAAVTEKEWHLLAGHSGRCHNEITVVGSTTIVRPVECRHGGRQHTWNSPRSITTVSPLRT